MTRKPIKKQKARIPPRKKGKHPVDCEMYIRSLREIEPHIMEALLNGDWDVKPPGKL